MQAFSAVILVIHVLIAVALVGVVLMQRSEGGGLGMGGRTDAFMSVRGQQNVLTRSTAILAGAFIITSIVLAFIGGTHSKRAGSIMDAAPPASAPATPGPGTGAPPAAPGGTAPAGTASPPAGQTAPQAPTR